MKNLIITALAVLSLSGCAYDSGSLDMGEVKIEGEPATTVTGQIKDASVQKEALYGQMRQNRDNKQKAMYDKSGFKQTWKRVEKKTVMKINGQEIVMESTEYLPEVEFREAPRFDQPLPTGPSEHPVWRFGEKVIDKGVDGFLWFTGIKQLGSVLKGAQDTAQPKYYGDYNPQTAEPYVVYPEIVPVP